MKLGIGIDTGGTYTDAVLYDFETKSVAAKTKTLTTNQNLEVGIGRALDALPADLLKQAEILSLSTTLATNACVEKKGCRAKVALLGTTRRTLEWIGAQEEYGLKDENVLCLDAQTSSDGKTAENPDWDAVTAANADWFAGAQALAVAELNAGSNGGACEKFAAEKLAEKYAVPTVAACELSSGLNLMERGATALLNARLLPILRDFLTAVRSALDKRGIRVKEMIVRSDGSLMSEEWALKHPVKTILSGPAASVIGGRGLTDRPNSLIVDMGGTTTDISIVRDGSPKMTDGIRIGGFRTQIRGVYIDTFGLGGDSRITIRENRPFLNERRVQPLCEAAAAYPQICGDLRELVAGKKQSVDPLHEFLCLVRRPRDLSGYDSHEIELMDRLAERPLMLGGNELDFYNLRSERLEEEGILMRCGLTPTDIMHIRGDFRRFSPEASVLGAKFLLKSLPDYTRDDAGLARFCDDIYGLVCRKLYENIVRVLLTEKYPKLFRGGLEGQLAGLIRESWYSRGQKDLFGLSFGTRAALVGIGAPTHLFLPRVAEALGAECVIPEHAEVANAVGAIIADISAQASVRIALRYGSDDPSAYLVSTAAGSRSFRKLEEAVAFAREAAEAEAAAEARKRGAPGELRVSSAVNTHTAYSRDGAAIDLGMTVTAVAAGRV